MHDRIDEKTVVEMTTTIVSAYLAHNPVPVSEIPDVIHSVATNLKTLSAQEQRAKDRPQPAVSARRSIGREHLTCLLCGKKRKVLKRHLRVEHHVTPGEYREMFGLRADYPMIAPNAAKRRSELARQIGLGRRPRTKGPRTNPNRQSAA